MKIELEGKSGDDRIEISEHSPGFIHLKVFKENSFKFEESIPVNVLIQYILENDGSESLRKYIENNMEI